MELSKNTITRPIIISGITLISGGILLLATNAFAATPTLSLSSSGGNAVQINVTGDPNSPVMFYYNVGSSSGMGVLNLGSTNSNGSFSTTINSSTNNISSGNSVYVIVNGSQSAMQPWPASSSGSTSGAPNLSLTNVTLGLGQTMTISSQGNSTGVYLTNNSNYGVANVQTNGIQITITGNQLGQATATICFVGTSSNCTNLNITVQSGSVLVFGQNNINLGVGQSMTVAVSGGSGAYSISSNPNPSIVSASLSNSSISLYGVAAGTDNISVCDSASNCGTLNVTAGGTSGTRGAISFDNSNVTIAAGQSVNVNASGGSGYYLAGNSNPSAVSLSVNGSVINISGLQAGAATVTVCSTANGCNSISVTVNSSGSANSGQGVNFGMSNPSLAVGQSASISLSGGGGYYISSNPNSSIAQASVNGSSLSLYGTSPGTDNLTVCASGGGCNTINVTVTGQAASQTTTPQTTSPAALLAAIQTMQSQLSQLISQIQTMANTLTQLAASVSANTAVVSNPSASTGSYAFTQFIGPGSRGAEVSALQQYLSQKGFYSGTISGNYGSFTEQAVRAYQSAHGISPLGYVGPSTRAALNSGK